MLTKSRIKQIILFVFTILILLYLVNSTMMLRWVITKATSKVPGSITIENIEGHLFAPIKLHKVHYNSNDIELTIEDTFIEWRPLSILRDNISITTLKIKNIDIKLKSEKSSLNQLKLPDVLPISVDSGIITNIFIRNSKNKNIRLIDEVKLSGNIRRKKLNIINFSISEVDYFIKVKGTISERDEIEVDATINWDWHGVKFKKNKGSAKLRGNNKLLNVDAVIVQPEKFNFNTVLGFENNFEVININKAILTQVKTKTKFQFNGKLNVNNDNWNYDGEAQWENIKWPLNDETYLISPTGKINGFITNNNYEISLNNTSLKYNTHLVDNIDALIIGDYEGSEIKLINSSVLEGGLEGTTKLNWISDLSWISSLHAYHLNPKALNIKEIKNWPGDISFNVKSKGTIINNDINANLIIEKAKGILREKLFSASGSLKMNKNNYSSNKIQINYGDSRINLSGNVEKNWNVNWDIEQADLNIINADISGKLTSKGTLTGERSNPVVKAHVNASNININQQQNIGTVIADINIDLSGDKQSIITAKAKNVEYQDYLVDEVNINVVGEPDDNQITLTAKSGNESFAFKLLGAINPKADNEWQGEIVEGKFHSDLTGDWQLKPGFGVNFSHNSYELQKSCWYNNNSSWCLDADWHQDKNFDTSFQFDNMSMLFFQAIINKKFKFNGTLNGSGEFHVTNNKIHDSKVSLSVANGTLDLITNKESTRLSTFQFGTFNLNQSSETISSDLIFQFSDKEIFTANLKLTSPNDSSLSFKDWSVDGQVNINTKHPEVVRLLYTDIEGIEGEWKSDIKLKGTLNNPKLTGYSIVNRSNISIPALGLKLNDASFDIHSLGINKFEITGGLKSGAGSIEWNGNIVTDPSKGWPMQLIVEGNNLQIVNVNESTIAISPNLQFKKIADRVDINGNIKIDNAKIKTKNALSQSVNLSNDIVFIDSQKIKDGVSDDDAYRKQSYWDIYSKIKFTLSDQVYFDSYGINGRLTGSVDVITEPGKITTGQGALHIRNGRYEFFSTVLNLDIGRLIFENDPITNPAINARASKRSGDITAGVRLTGHIKSPEVNIYSIPTMPESEAVSYLLFGKLAKNNSIGLDSLRSTGTSDGTNSSTVSGIGSYIDYAVGLFNSTSILRIRFELNKNWELYTESSIDNRGAEIIYTFER